MSDYELNGSDVAVELNKSRSVGVFSTESVRSNQTRTTLFTPEYLLEWAKAVAEAYEDEPAIEVVFTPKKPMVAQHINANQIGIGIAPRLRPDEWEELDGDSNE